MIIDWGVCVISNQENVVLCGVIEKPVFTTVDDVVCGVFEMPVVTVNNLDPPCICDILCPADVPFGICKDSIRFPVDAVWSAVCVVTLGSKF